jgi:hypothetical protein
VASLGSIPTLVPLGEVVALLLILGGFVAAIWLPIEVHFTVRSVSHEKLFRKAAQVGGVQDQVSARVSGFAISVSGVSLSIATETLETVATLADRLAPAAKIVGESGPGPVDRPVARREPGRGDEQRAPTAEEGRREDGSGEARPIPSTRLEPLPPPAPSMSAEERARLRAQLDISGDEPQTYRGHRVVPFLARDRRRFRALGNAFVSFEAALDLVDRVPDRRTV